MSYVTPAIEPATDEDRRQVLRAARESQEYESFHRYFVEERGCDPTEHHVTVDTNEDGEPVYILETIFDDGRPETTVEFVLTLDDTLSVTDGAGYVEYDDDGELAEVETIRYENGRVGAAERVSVD